jgi:hypothetical protein
MARLSALLFLLVASWSSLVWAESVGFAPVVRVLEREETFSGIALPAGTTVTLTPTDAPALLRVETAIATTILGATFPPRSIIDFRGVPPRPVEARLGAEASIQSIACMDLVRFHPNGSLAGAQIAKDTELGGTVFPAKSFLFFVEQELSVQSASLSRPTRIQSVLCDPAERVEFYPSHRIRSAELAEDRTIASIRFPAHTSMAFFENGSPGHATLPGRERSTFQFSDDGLPVSAHLAEPMTIATIAFPPGTELEFTAGKLSYAKLWQAATIRSISVARGSILRFRADGSLESLDPGYGAPATTIDSVPCQPGSSLIRFWPNGRLQEATLAAATTIQSHALPKNVVVHFDEQRRLDYVDLHWVDEEPTLGGIICAKEAMVRFHKNGQLREAELARQATIQSIPCARREFVQFHDNGRLARAVLATPLTIEGVEHRAGSLLLWDSTGRLIAR